MKSYKYLFILCCVLIFASCNQGNGGDDKKVPSPIDQDKTIKIVHIKVDGDVVSETQVVSALGNTSKLEIEFKEAYQDLKVMVGKDAARIEGKVAKFTLKDITEVQKSFNIKITAKDKTEKLVNLKIKKKPLESMGIDQILLGTETCNKDATTTVKTADALLTVKFMENYPELKVQVDWKGQKHNATVEGQNASFQVIGITSAKNRIEIIATAKGRVDKKVPFFVQKEDEGARSIVITGVTIDNVPCTKKQIVESKTATPMLKVTFAQKYEELAVRVNGRDAEVEGNAATYQFSDVDENKIEVKIVATAKDKDEENFDFFLKKQALKKMTINKVLLDTVECKQNEQTSIKTDSATLTVAMNDAYPDMAIFAKMGDKNEVSLQVSGKNATVSLDGFTENPVTIKLRATATGYIEETYTFTAKKEKEIVVNNNAFLKSFVFSSGEHIFDLDTEFKKDKDSYEVYVAAKYTEFTLSAEAENKDATVSSVKKEEEAGNEVYSVEVTASNRQTKKTYRVTVKKIPSLTAEKREVVAVPVPKGGIEFPHGLNDEETQRVEKAFSIGKYPVTYQLWYEVYNWAAQHGYKFKNAGVAGRDGDASSANYPNGSPKPADIKADRKFFPVTNISWYDAIVWLNAYSVMEGYNAIYIYQADDGSTEILKDATAKIEGKDILKCAKAVAREKEGFRLPRELEWRCVARWQGTQDKGNSKGIKQKDGTIYYFTKGDSASGASSNSKEDATIVAWFSEDGNYEHHMVGKKQPNALGIFDMSGLVEEWLFDGDGAKKRYLIGGHVDKEEVAEIAVGSDLDTGTEAGAADDYMSIRVVKNEK